MRYVLTILIIAFLFLTACGNDVTDDKLTENISDAKEKIDVKKIIECEEDHVFIDGECLPIDPYNLIKDESEEEDEIIEKPQIEMVENDVSDVKTFEIQVEDYKFMMGDVENPEIRVRFGDKVIIKLTSTKGSHNWNVNQLAARSRTVSTNETTTLEFIANRNGTFDYYCAVGKHRDIGIEGTFIVE